MSSPDELYFQIALTMVPRVGIVRAHKLLDHFKSARMIFHTPVKELAPVVENVGAAREIMQFRKWKEVDQTVAYIQKHKIQTFFLTDEGYPSRLRNCYDPPVLLYYLGTSPLNRLRVISVIGTREPSEYGRQLTATLLRELAPYDVLVVSGLADGIDAQAHRCALGQDLPTVGVLGHGLDKIYPSYNRLLAKEMISNGGVLTEFRQHTRPEKFHFPMRNRIVAGMSDATVIVETPIKGGSMGTADLAFGYHRDVFAFPGKTTSLTSEGCHALIRQNKAALVTSALDIAYYLNWELPAIPATPGMGKAAGALPESPIISGEGEHAALLHLLQNKESIHIDELRRLSGLTATMLATTLLSLELQQLIEPLPGMRYRLFTG